ncbi:MAG: serine--tRNA ligase [Alphaproteobacteria bacterium 13_2_20CM_2_64_7]|jgi:seryl-tRNA synthetase|nr:MAG: serine--tRNA ligase [Alphaproteobacteria bacterium 13_2_20CM_2_64_7]
MHDIKWIRDNPDAFDRALARRGLPAEAKRLIEIDERRRAAIQKAEAALARRNTASREIGAAKKSNEEAAAQALLAEVARLKAEIPQLEEEAKKASKELDDALAQIPNLPLDEVPDGKDPSDNVEHHRFGAKRDYGFQPEQHFDLGEALGQMDFETAAKLSGARFVVLKGGLARLERALAQFMLDLHTTEHGYTEVAPPLLVRNDVMFGTAQLPKFAEDQFQTGRLLSDDERASLLQELPEQSLLRLGIEYNLIAQPLWLIPTAEVPLTNLVRQSILEEDALPLRFTAGTPCFRAEAGAAGKDTRGMIRQHQFDKVELVSITTPEQSRDELERMLACAEEVLRRLDLHYRVVTLCAGDMGFAAQKTYDIEVWLPGQNMYREISSCSLCGEFQARRMDARYRTKGGRQVRHVHTLNGSGVAVGRTLIAVMETYQQQGGSIAIPDVLQNYMGGLKTIERPGKDR